jgi:hypothetical protein
MANSNKEIKINLKNDLQRRNHTSLVRFPEPEIVDEIFDVMIGEKNYRVFVNRKLNRVTCNEIVSYDYKGMILLKNPVDRNISRQMLDLIQKLPINYRLDTLANAKQGTVKLNKLEKLALQSKKQPVGNHPSRILIRATLWCIDSHPKHLKSKTPTLKQAYKKFGGEKHTEKSFIDMVRQKWNDVIKKYSRLPEEIKKEKTLKIYAKSELKIPRNVSKQKTSNDKKLFRN